MATVDTIAQKLKDALSPQHLEVEDVSHEHAGHSGWREGGGTHFTVKIKSHRFANKTRLQQHRLVNTILKDELNDEIHALELHLSS